MPRTGILYRHYRGRFAPTPSGPFHFGSLVAAAGSYLDARQKGGEWLVRIEDLDPPRVVRGAADGILRTLEAFGFEWDGPVMWQSLRNDAYRAAFEELKARRLVYACYCSRAGCVGRCREKMLSVESPRSWRVHGGEVPDFVVLRADGVFSYHLAVVVDDAEQGITDVVRGADLLDSMPRQVRLQQLFGYPTPRYVHLPIACNANGEKLSKQTHAPAISSVGDAAELAAALRFLGYLPPENLKSIAELWRWALSG